MNELKSLIPQDMPLDNSKIHDLANADERDKRLSVRSRIAALEKGLAEITGSARGNMDEIDEKGLQHHRMPGVYVRELFIPKDTVMVSKLHKKTRMWIIAQGEVTFRTEYGARHVKAPYVEVVQPWSKVALYAHEDTFWFAIHRSDNTDLKDLEDELIADDFDNEVMPCHGEQ